MYSVYLRDYNSTPSEHFVTRSSEKLYIYDQMTSDESLAIVEPELTLAASKAGDFTCTIPRTNNGFNKIIKGVTRLFVTKNEKIIFMGRINEVEEDLWLNQVITAEGALAYLNDSLSEKKIYSNENNNQTLEFLLTVILNHHNSKFPDEPWKQFNIAVCEAKFVGRDDKDVSSNYLSYYSINFDKTLELVTELVELADGAFKIEFNETLGTWDMYIYNKYNFPVNDSQPIEFGVNLLDLTKTNSFNDICTVVAPFGGDLIQTSKEIGEAVAGQDIDMLVDPTKAGARWYPDAIWIRPKDNPEAAYYRDQAADAGYWVFELWINDYNAANPNNPLKQLYVSWRGYYFETHSGEHAPEGYVEDCAWRIYDASGNTIGYRKFENEGFDSNINELIDLTSPQFLGAQRIVVSGWGYAIKPLIRRNATVIEENDKLSIEKCSEFVNVGGLTHFANSPYLISNNLVDQYGVIEKKIEYDIEDSVPKVNPWVIPIYPNEAVTQYGIISKYVECYLGYEVGNVGDEPNYNLNKGNFQILDGAGAGYDCIQYELPPLGNANRPRGVYISSRMHTINGLIDDRGDGKLWKVNGMYALYDDAWQVLNYKEAGADLFTSVKDEYIDLSDPKNYGARYIRVGGWGGSIPVNVVASDDAYAQDRLMAQAKLYLTSYQWEKVVIEATAVDLSMTDDQWESLEICSNVPVISGIPGGMYFPLTTLTIRLDSFEDNKIVLGYDNEDYISNQLSESARLANIAKAIEERRTKQ